MTEHIIITVLICLTVLLTTLIVCSTLLARWKRQADEQPTVKILRRTEEQ